MNKIYVDQDIYYVENILSAEDLASVQNFAKIDSDWEISNNGSHMKRMPYDIETIFYNMTNDIIKKLEPDLEISNAAMIRRFKENTIDPNPPNYSGQWSMLPHEDNKLKYSDTHYIAKGIIFYINDDFEGGEIDYIDKGIVIKPIANSLLVHNASNTHGVKLVTKGDRYIMANFYKKAD